MAFEAPNATRVFEVLGEAGWRAGEPWTPLRRDLTAPVDAPGLRVEVVEAGHSAQFTAVHRAVWGNDRFTDERWRAMADGPAFARARCLLGRDSSGVAVAGPAANGPAVAAYRSAGFEPEPARLDRSRPA
ncbi:hypothetical protein [Cellulomonas sp. PSBB021]|uniref:hypothetical protein n=1 Tax=Cellulomonas sp. PSBB021 TaxID=2003551 RepID=UPI0012FDDF31|nr:hypothetical protein [Cellulomonas sp. PSBB021]